MSGTVPGVDREAIGNHLSVWDREKAIQAARDVEALMEQPGWAALLESAEIFERDLNKMLLFGKASENAAEYATKVGEMRGLRRLPQLAQGIVDHGSEAAKELRELQNEPAEEAV